MSAAAQIQVASAAVLDLTFEPERHEYRWKGQLVPGVTSILQDAKLIDYSGIPRRILDKASARGTYVHKMLELYDLGTLDEEQLPAEYRGYLDAYRDFCRVSGFRVGHIENRRYHLGRHYAGTFDRTGFFEVPGVAVSTVRPIMLDFKTGEIQDGHFLQLVAYTNLLPDPLRFRSIALQVSANGRYRVHEVPSSDHDYCTQIFYCALTCVQHRLAKGKR